MANYNRVTLIGNLTRDIEMRATQVRKTTSISTHHTACILLRNGGFDNAVRAAAAGANGGEFQPKPA